MPYWLIAFASWIERGSVRIASSMFLKQRDDLRGGHACRRLVAEQEVDSRRACLRFVDGEPDAIERLSPFGEPLATAVGEPTRLVEPGRDGSFSRLEGELDVREARRRGSASSRKDDAGCAAQNAPVEALLRRGFYWNPVLTAGRPSLSYENARDN